VIEQQQPPTPSKPVRQLDPVGPKKPKPTKNQASLATRYLGTVEDPREKLTTAGYSIEVHNPQNFTATKEHIHLNAFAPSRGDAKHKCYVKDVTTKEYYLSAEQMDNLATLTRPVPKAKTKRKPIADESETTA
jgi:hypothetical protein